MDDLKFFELFGDIDAELVQQANDDLNAWQEAREGIVVRAGSSQRTPLKIVFASVACAAAVFGAVFLLRNYLKNGFTYVPEYPNSSTVQGGESNAKITEEYIKTLNSVIDTSTNVDALNSSIKGADGDDLVQKVQVFEHPNAFEQDVVYSAGELKDGAIVLVDFNDGTHYITSRGERTTEPVPVPMMFSHIVRRAGSVEQLKEEIDGYNRGLGDRALTKITLYQNSEDARNGNDNGVTLLENGKIVASDEDFKKGKVARVEYYGGKSWIEFSLEGAKIRYDENSGESEISINSEVMWGLGKTMDELTEIYGEIVGSTSQMASFKNGYGIYAWSVEGGSCTRISRIKASDLLIGDLSTVNFDNIVSKCGFEVILFDPENNDGPGMYDDAKVAYFSHPSYKNITFQMTYKISGFDEDATFLVSYDDDNPNVPSGEPTFLVGPDGKPIYTGEITRLENTDKTAETLTEEDYDAMIYCDGFAYFIEPCGIGYDNYKNPELFDGTVFIGEVPENKNEWKRAYVGDEIFGLKVRSAYSEFYIHNPDIPPYTGVHLSNSVFEFEGTLEVEGFLCIDKKYNDLDVNELMFLFAPTADIPLAPIYPYASDEEMYAARFEEHLVYDPGNKYLCVGEYYPIQLGRFADVSCDLDGIGLGDIAYVRVTLNNISIIENIICATLDKVELLSDILAHDE